MSKQSHSCNSGSQKKQNEKNKLEWWQLSLIGVGCTIGTGYFLGSSIGIITTGPSIVFSFIMAAVGTYIVYRFLAKMTADDPLEGSFCSYAKKAFGQWAGFSCGWIYWSSNILIMGSQLTALSILSKFWFHQIPLWVFSTGYGVTAIIVVLLGTKGFGKIENILAIIKTAAIVMFILLAFSALLNWIPGDSSDAHVPHSMRELFPHQFIGFWSSLIYAFYAFGGIEVIGLMAMQLKKKEDAPKSGSIMLLVLTIIYVLSLGLAVCMLQYQRFSEDESPFVKAMENTHLSFFPHVFNGAIIIAGFSTMTAALFGVTNLLVTLAKDGDAPSFFALKVKKINNLPLPSLGIATLGMLISIITALLLPDKTYEYITTAAGILLLFNWLFIIISAIRILKLNVLDKWMASIGILFLIGAISGTMMEKMIRPGFFVSIISVAVIVIISLILTKLKAKKKEK
ncbi:amino acid permease [Terrilactibacillus tamarindi]|uniref:amino acid permease n=1 Tax=Terrilactibacillus tamarindi TaxID=2599694 RepID=UPI001E42D4F8|nr:amino acid permease [Terrilactibacillus tamarindi]